MEDSGTGSACANLGGYFLAQGRFPLSCLIRQGDQMGRPNRLYLTLDAQQTIYVGGNVVEVGEGVFRLA
ncbi:PhzF family phenazine biosynthesis protein [Muribacter muris]|uniref:PhzF family phenazine biosynthesis protein n=1 Tax=Muribacter muris TaxID=67855 RepID=UPI001F4C6B1D|nr:PhzF family phenazine biosynthesis protein [Muribacter muris]